MPIYPPSDVFATINHVQSVRKLISERHEYHYKSMRLRNNNLSYLATAGVSGNACENRWREIRPTLSAVVTDINLNIDLKRNRQRVLRVESGPYLPRSAYRCPVTGNHPVIIPPSSRRDHRTVIGPTCPVRSFGVEIPPLSFCWACCAYRYCVQYRPNEQTRDPAS